MTFLLVSFVAGMLTVLAPCVLPLLPIVIGSSATARSRSTPYIVVLSLGLSIIAFTFLLKVSSAFISVPPQVWTYLSGGIIALFGVTLVFPSLWDNLPGVNALFLDSNKLLGSGLQKKSLWGDTIIGASLGPVFSTCSPTYFLILASVLPASFFLGTVYLLAYVVGLSCILLPIGIFGERFIGRISFLADPQGHTRRVIGILFLILGLLITFGYEKRFEAYLLDGRVYDITQIEQALLKKEAATSAPVSSGERYKEIADPAGFVNTDPITIGQFIGKKVILVDFLAYSCINCQRTFPYLNAWYDKYKDQGLIIIGIHTPEFAFEKNIDNVRAAMQRFGIQFPIVLDNDYGTWNAFGNQYWPHKYLIDLNGNIVYDHIGEGGYDETETEIRKLLAQPDNTPLAATQVPVVTIGAQSPETYFGSARNEYLANGTAGKSGIQTFALPEMSDANALYLSGTWDMESQYAQSITNATVRYTYTAKEAYLVADAVGGAEVEVMVDGKPAGTLSGEDVRDGILRIKESRLYKVTKSGTPETHTLELRVKSGSVRFYTFTFG